MQYNPYHNFKLQSCNPPTGYHGPIKFKKLLPNNEDQVFFEPVRRNASRIFAQKGNYGCIRDDIMNVDEDFYDLSCNTNISYSIERNKFVLINAIIEESIKTNGDSSPLNTSDRTKLVLMDEEELINKASKLGLNMTTLNEYTKPKLINTVKDIYNPHGTPKFEKWDELESKYLKGIC